jgi:TolB-like protein
MQMAKAVNADVVLTGVSRVSRLANVGSTEGPVLRVEVSMRAIRVSDGTILAASSASRDVASALATQDQAVDDLTSQLVGRLAASLTDTWEK